jgi:cytochrome oxidase Cu insertion factor (SCO1/SenC/PrrC family)
MTHAMRGLQRELPLEVQLVSISVDPARDTPSVLASYARNFEADLRNWAFLTGSAEEIQRVVQEGFRLVLADGESPSEPITHSVRFLLVDGQGQIRGTFDGTDPKGLEELKRAANTLLKEKG